jgi:uncharacterized DUF497 family protein
MHVDGEANGLFFDDNEELFIWDDKNIEHIARHHVELEEAEEAFLDPIRIRFNAHSGNLGIIGSTEEGRRLVVIYVKKEGYKYRVITARDADEDEKKQYKRRTRL